MWGSPTVMHSKVMHQQRSIVKCKLSAIRQNQHKSFSKVAKTQALDISFDDKLCASSDAIATQNLNTLMLDLKAKF